jgi:hypothetical protein
MSRHKTIELSIPQPCTQNWDGMSVNETGRFCDSCNKSVIDFTNYSDQQLIEFFKGPKENVCGKLRHDQLGKSLYLLQYQQSRPFPQFFISAALVIGLGNSVNAKEKHAPTIINVVQNETKEEKENNETTGDDSTRYFSGQVIDMKTKETVPGATVLLEGATIGTATDINGFFKLDISDQLDKDTIHVIVSFLGYETQTVKFTPKAIPQNQVIEIEANTVLGGMEIIYNRTPKTLSHCFPIPLRYKVKNWVNKWFGNKA